MPRVLLVPDVLENALSGEEFELDSETAKKLTRVLRMSPGDSFVAFDGQGREWECVLTSTGQPRAEEDEGVRLPRSKGGGKARASALIVEEHVAAPPARLHLSVAQAVPKGDKMDLVLQKGTELGVAEFWPFEAERSVSRLLDDETERAGSRTERWRRIVEAAAAQCGRADVPVVHAVADLSTVLGFGTSAGRCLLLDESEEALPLREALQREPLNAPGVEAINDDDEPPLPVMLLVGPEGGWSEREREQAGRYGAEAVSLGRRILRTETAALIAAAILQWEAGEL